MIVRDAPSVWQVYFVWRGSIVNKILPQLAFVVILSVLVVVLHKTGQVSVLPIPPLALTIIGAALAIFAAFRNAAAYDRWWEARKLHGLIVIDARGLARHARSYVGDDDFGKRMSLRCIAFLYLVRDFLRGLPPAEDGLRYLSEAEREGVIGNRNPPNRLMDYMSADIADAVAADRVSPQMARTLEESVNGLNRGFASCERTKVTPMPFVYSLLVDRTAYLYALLLPFGLVEVGGLWTPLLAVVICYAFFGLDTIGDELAVPFSSGANGLPLGAVARAVEINILQSLGERELPPPLTPRNYVLM